MNTEMTYQVNKLVWHAIVHHLRRVCKGRREEGIAGSEDSPVTLASALLQASIS